MTHSVDAALGDRAVLDGLNSGDFGQVAGWLSVQRGLDEPETGNLTELARQVERGLEEKLAGSQDLN